MARYTRTPVSTLQGINNELAKVELAMEDTLDRKGVTPNYMDSNLDMNSRRILNLPTPLTDQEPLRRGDIPTGLSISAQYVDDSIKELTSDYTLRVQSVESLQALEVSLGRIGERIYINEYYEGTGYGQGLWEITTGESDNGASIIQSDVNSSIQFKNVDREARMESYGAKGDGVNDDSLAYLACMQSGLRVGGRQEANYRITQPFSGVDRSIYVNLIGTTLSVDADIQPFSMESNFESVQSVTAIDYTAKIDLRNGDSGGLTTTMKLTLSDASEYSKDDIIKIVSDDFISATDPSDNEKIGEFAKVALVDGNDIYLYSFPRESFITNVRVAKVRTQDQVECYFGKINFINYQPQWSDSCISITGCFEPVISGKTDKCVSEFIELNSCLNPKTINVSVKSAITSFANFAYGYGIVEYSCEGGVHVSPEGYDCRHVYTTGTRGAENLSDIKLYGRTANFRVVNGYGKNCQNSAFDTHPDSFGGVFDSCIAELPYNGPLGTQRNYQLRGQYATIQNCQSIGGVGFYINGTHDDADTARGNKIIDCTHTMIAVTDQKRAAVQVSGRSGYPVIGARLINLTVNQSVGDDAHLEVDNAEVEVINPNFNAGQTGDFVSKVILAGDNATVSIKGGETYYRDATASGLRFAKLTKDTAKVSVSGMNFKGGFSYLADLDGGNGIDRDASFIAEGIKVDSSLAQSSGDGVTNVGANASVSVEYEVLSGIGEENRVFSVTYNSSGSGKVVDTSFRAGDLVCKVTAAVGIPEITEISKGKQGQLLTLFAEVGSFTLSSGTNLQVPVSTSVDNGTAVTLVYLGTTWYLSN